MADDGVGPWRPAPGIIWALGASLLINIAMVGGGVGYWAATRRAPPAPMAVGEPASWTPGRGGPPRDVWARELTPRTFILALPPRHRRAAIRKVIREGRASVELVRANMEAREAVLAAMFADEYDSDAVAQALARARDTEAQLVARGHEILLTVIDEIPADQRARALATLRANLDSPKPVQRQAPPPRRSRSQP